jgi:cytochrome c553
MAPQAANLSQRDMEDLAAYFSHQQGLVTRKNSYFVH